MSSLTERSTIGRRLTPARPWAQGIVIRIDSAYSDEGVGLQMMVSQPFQF